MPKSIERGKPTVRLQARVMRYLRVYIILFVRHHICVRTTLALDDDVFELVQRQAKLRGVSLGQAVSDLVRRGLTASTPSRELDGLIVFQLPADSPTVTTDDVRRIEVEGV